MARMEDNSNAYMTLVEMPEGRQLGRLENNIKIDYKEVRW